VHDTVFVLQQNTGWPVWVQLLAGLAQIVLALALLSVGSSVLLAARRVRVLMRRVEEHGHRLRVDLAPIIRNLTVLTENVNFISRTVRRDADRLSQSVNSVTDKLHEAAEVAQTRVGEFNALIGVVQEEAEAIFIGGASTLRGVQAGADTFRRFQTGDLEYLGEVYLDEDEEDGLEDFSDEDDLDDDFEDDGDEEDGFGADDYGDEDDDGLDDDGLDDDALEPRDYAEPVAEAYEEPEEEAPVELPARPARAGRRAAPHAQAADAVSADMDQPTPPPPPPSRGRGRKRG
jgi:hypothetical protein